MECWWWGGKGDGSRPPFQPASASLAWSQVEDTGLPALEPEASLAYPMATHSEQPAFPVFSSLPSPPHPRRPGGCSSHCPGLSRGWPLTVLVSQEVTAAHLRAGRGWDALPTGHGLTLGSSQKGRVFSLPPSLSGCVSTPSGPRFRRNTFPGRAATSASQPHQRNCGPRRQAPTHAH